MCLCEAGGGVFSGLATLDILQFWHNLIKKQSLQIPPPPKKEGETENRKERGIKRDSEQQSTGNEDVNQSQEVESKRRKERSTEDTSERKQRT